MITKTEDYIEQSQGLLLEQYQEKPRIAAWLRSYSRQAQELENVFWDVIVKRLIDNAEGDQLDMLGAIVVEPRRGRDDAVYKLFVLAKIRLNWSQGNPDDVIEVLKIVESSAFTYTELYPASLEVQFDEVPSSDGITLAILAELVRRAREGGMSSAVVGSMTYDVDEQIRFVYLDDMGATDAAGFSNNAETTGGVFTSIYT